MEEAKEVTLEEELAILKAKSAIDELTQAQDGSREKEIELSIAKAKHTELIKESTSATSEQITKQRQLEQALSEQTRAEENLTRAQNLLTKATEDYNEATAKTPENILRIALAKEELDKQWQTQEV